MEQPPGGSVYSRAQFEDWLAPLSQRDGQWAVLELGCGNGSLLVPWRGWPPRALVGVDLGDSVTSARANLARTGRAEIDAWLAARHDRVDPASVYVVARNGNSWKFGGRTLEAAGTG